MSREAVSYPAIHTTGPIHHYIRASGTYGTGDIWYLGTCETQPVLRINRYSKAVFNDIAGRSVPIQETHDGHDADLGLALSRFSQLAYLQLQKYSDSNNSVYEANGDETFLSRGSLVYGARTFELWQWFSFYNTVAAQNSMPCGYYFPQCKLVAHNPEKWGSEGEVLMLTAKATPRWIVPVASGVNASTASVNTGGVFRTYTQNVSFFPSSVQLAR